MNRREFIISLASAAAFPKFGLACNKDPNNLADKLIAFSKTCKIPTVNGLEYFNPRPYQIEYFKRLVNSSKLICKKCRQCGATTINLIYANWKDTIAKNHNFISVWNSIDAVRLYQNYGSLFYKTHNFSNSNNRFVGLTYQQFLSCFNENDDFSNSTYIFDEYAFYGSSKLNTLIEKISQAKNSQVIVTSTMNRHEDAFSKLFDEADESSKHVISCYDAYDYYKLNNLRSTIDDKQFNLEYDA